MYHCKTMECVVILLKVVGPRMRAKLVQPTSPGLHKLLHARGSFDCQLLDFTRQENFHDNVFRSIFKLQRSEQQLEIDLVWPYSLSVHPTSRPSSSISALDACGMAEGEGLHKYNDQLTSCSLSLQQIPEVHLP